MTDSDRAAAYQFYSDYHKDVYGFRPRTDVSEWTREDFEAEYASLGREQLRVEEDERQQKAARKVARVAEKAALAARAYETRTWKRLAGEREKIPTQGNGWRVS